MIHSGKTKLAGIMGWPVQHSKSPRLHGYWLREHGIDGAYLPLAVSPENLGNAVEGLAALGFTGANLTIPHKEAVLAFCDEIDPAALRIGAVNTLVIGEGGSICGSNTDGYGFLENLKTAPAWQAAAGPAVLLGAGGAARAIAAALEDAGVPELRLVNRTRERAEALIAETGLTRAQALPWETRNDALAGAALLVNTTSLGMEGKLPLEIDLAALPVAATVNDIVYAPLETPLLAAAAARGNPTVDGLGMLLHQARPGFAQWYGTDPEVTEALRTFVLGDG
jgi:shikimate dehydrogenase